MSFYVKSRSFVDQLTDVDFVDQNVPEARSALSFAQRMRGLNDLIESQGGKWGGDSEMRHVAHIPKAVWEAWLIEDPDLQWRKDKFYKRLDKHPEYCTYSRVKGGSVR